MIDAEQLQAAFANTEFHREQIQGFRYGNKHVVLRVVMRKSQYLLSPSAKASSAL